MAQATTKQHLDIHGKPYQRGLVMAIMLIAGFAAMMMQTSLGTAVPTLMKAFDINLATAQQASTWFLLGNGIMVPVSAFLATRFRTRTLQVTAYTTLLLGVAITAFTPEKHSMWWLFLAGRIVAAMSWGVLMPLMQVIIITIFKPNERGAAMGMMGLVIGMSPAIGPTLTGWILDKSHVILGLTISNSWRTVFYLPMIVLAIALVAGFFLLRDVLPNRKVTLDIPSMLMTFVGFGLFLLGFTNVASDGWGDLANVIAPIGIGTLIIIFFIFRQLHLDRPFMDVRVFLNKRFTLTTIAVMMTTMAMMGVEMMLPTYLQNVHGMSALTSGLTLLPGALMMGLMSPIAGMMYNRVGVKRLAILGFTILAIGTLPFMFLTAQTPSAFITLLYGVRMFGVAITMMPLTTAAMSALPLDQATDGTASNNTARQIASSVVVALLSSVTQNVITNNTPSHALKLANPLLYADHFLNASMKGFRVSFILGFAFAVIGIIVALFVKNQDAASKDVDLQQLAKKGAK